jgi:folate-dependent phosphoribosylglycinamide formyltransferase PurN
MASAFRLLYDAGHEVDAVVVTDRACLAESVTKEMGFRHRRIEYTSRDEFSQSAATWLYDECGVDWICLLFQRLVTSSLFERGTCVNIHPSLLPSFPGLKPLQQARDSGAYSFGATAHLVDESIDGGPILAQAVAKLSPDLDLETMKRISFAQKVYLLLVLTERMTQLTRQGRELLESASREICDNVSHPIIDSTLSEAFSHFVHSEGIPWEPRIQL